MNYSQFISNIQKIILSTATGYVLYQSILTLNETPQEHPSSAWGLSTTLKAALISSS